MSVRLIIKFPFCWLLASQTSVINWRHRWTLQTRNKEPSFLRSPGCDANGDQRTTLLPLNPRSNDLNATKRSPALKAAWSGTLVARCVGGMRKFCMMFEQRFMLYLTYSEHQGHAIFCSLVQCVLLLLLRNKFCNDLLRCSARHSK